MAHLFKAAILAMLLAGSNAAADNHFENPSSLIKTMAQNMFEKIDQQRDAIKNDPAIAEEIVRTDLLPLLDVTYSARLILGREARGISEEKLLTFATAMNDQLISRYSSGVLEFRSREQIEVLEMKGEINKKATRVKTRFRLDSGGFALVDYVFRLTPEGWKVFDVVVEGISYVISFQGQIKQEVRANGLDAVIERLSSGNLDLAG
jgi:phospholipid transport system substrate-binding protein